MPPTPPTPPASTPPTPQPATPPTRHAAGEATRLRHRPLRESLQFLGNFLRYPGSVGAVLPSSRWLAEALTRDLPVAAGDLVLEYGPGTGPMTVALEPYVARGVHYLGIERNGGFCELLLQRFPRLQFHHGSVEDVAAILEQRGLGQQKARAIVSGLPFASFPGELQQRVIAGIEAVLAPGGEFRTFQYVHAYRLPAARRFRRTMEGHFRTSTCSRPVLRNVPPAYVLVYRA